jgi:hypothetical protein
MIKANELRIGNLVYKIEKMHGLFTMFLLEKELTILTR